MNILKFDHSLVVVEHIKMVEKVYKNNRYGFYIHFEKGMYSASWFLTEKERDEEYEKIIMAIAEQ